MTPEPTPNDRRNSVSVYDLVTFLTQNRRIIGGATLVGCVIALFPTLFRVPVKTVIARFEIQGFETSLRDASQISANLHSAFSNSQIATSYAQTLLRHLDPVQRTSWLEQFGSVDAFVAYLRERVTRNLRNGGSPKIGFLYMIEVDPIGRYVMRLRTPHHFETEQIYRATHAAIAQLVQEFNHGEKRRRGFLAETSIDSNQKSLRQVLQVIAVDPAEYAITPGTSAVYNQVARDMLHALTDAHPFQFALPDVKAVSAEPRLDLVATGYDQKPLGFRLVLGTFLGLAAGVFLAIAIKSYELGKQEQGHLVAQA